MNQDLTRRSLIIAGAVAGASSLVGQFFPGTAWAQLIDRKQEKVMKTDAKFTSAGNRLAGNLYVPEGVAAGKRPAIVVGHPSSGVKEQTAGLYAQRLAEQGFVTLTFDTGTQGESEGMPRGTDDAGRRIEEFKDAVSFLTMCQEVDPDRIGILGICASGGCVVPTAVTDKRIKAVATVSGVDLATWHRIGGDGKQNPAVFQGMLDKAAAARTAEARGEKFEMLQIQPNTREEAIAAGPQVLDGYDYYRGRGEHPRQAREFDWTSIDRTAIVDGFRFIDMLSPRPLLMIVGTEATTKWMSEDAFKRAKEPKQLFEVDGATHCGLYDKPEYVTPAVAKMTDFFHTNLKA